MKEIGTAQNRRSNGDDKMKLKTETTLIIKGHEYKVFRKKLHDGFGEHYDTKYAIMFRPEGSKKAFQTKYQTDTLELAARVLYAIEAGTFKQVISDEVLLEMVRDSLWVGEPK